MEANFRQQRCSAAADQLFDVVIAGGGISGAAIFSRLASCGYRVLLIDKGDFGSFTSQESAMMIWGGLLYLTRFDVKTVYTLSRDRDQLLKRYPEAVHAQYYRYLPLKSGWQLRPLVKGFFDIYRALGGLRRSPNLIEENFAEESLVAMPRYRGSVAYEEALLTTSDSRFILNLIRSHETPSAIPLNYVSLEEGGFDHSRHLWRLALRNHFDDDTFEVQARLVINATGPHVDRVNRHFSIESPYKHVFSKGVLLSFARPDGHNAPLIFELGKNRDVLLFTPWGPVSYWGPTESATDDLESATEPLAEDVEFLLEQANVSLNYPVTPRDIIAYRCGVRPLAVEKSYSASKYPLELSRHHRVHVVRRRPWIAVYGGKFTSALGMAESIEGQVAALLGKPRTAAVPTSSLATPPLETSHPGLDAKFPSIAHCVEHEYCLTIGDYLRRRTNIAQWVARNGLGNNHEHLPFIEQLAGQLPRAVSQNPGYTLDHYINETKRIFDRLQGVDGEIKL